MRQQWYHSPGMLFRNGGTEAPEDLLQGEAAGLAERAGHPGGVALRVRRTLGHLKVGGNHS